MKKTAIILVSLLSVASLAQAQIGDIIRRVDPNKIRAGVNMGRAVAHEYTEEEEIELGRVVAARVLATYPLSSNDRLQKYVTLVGNTVAAYSARPSLNWHFAVIDTPVINAFSTPGGYVFVTTGALNQMKSESELAAVLGHEVAHCTEKHILKEIKRANVYAASVDVASAQSNADWLTEDLAKKVADLANEKLFKTGIGRKEELDADRIGAQLAVAAGYRDDGATSFLTTLQGIEGTSSAMKQLTATHPRAADRITSLNSAIRPKQQGELLADRFKSWTTR